MLRLSGWKSRKRVLISFRSDGGFAQNLASRSHKCNNSPITADEFREYFQACKPTESWPEKLAVAFSGGPDSTCLLYLLNKLLSTDTIDYSLPKSLVAITIDHGLQTASSQMTKRCIALANSLQVEHLVLKIPWSTPPFSALPPDGSSFENVAREARYHLLLAAMRREGVAAIAFGHHADDQVETALLRVARGSAEVGAAGMRACRRWGMGFGSGPQNVGWAGQHGMNRWVVRPLLLLPKERLVATCRESGLEYIEDPTNFQPDVAIRNRIRHSLESLDSLSTSSTSSIYTLASESKILLDMASRASSSANEHGHQRYKSMITKEEEELSIVRLRSAVRAISEFVLSLEDKVTIELANCTRPSPVSTIFLSEDALACVTDNTVRLGMVRRILRYVSPFPWGSPRGEAGRRTSSLQRISDHIWQAAGRPPTKLVAGGGVLWTPVSITRDGTMKLRSGAGSSGEVGWLATRQPPIRRFDVRDADAGFVAPELDMKPNPLELDITPMILSAVEQNSEDAVEILYDCRFLLHIKLHRLPSRVINALTRTGSRCKRLTDLAVRVIIVPHTRYFLPKVVLRKKNTTSSVLLHGPSEPQDAELASLLPEGSTDFPIHENNKERAHPTHDREAVRIEWIRVLDADVPYKRLQEASLVS